MIFVCPPVDEILYPTLGPQVCDFISERLVHGPGDLLGEPVRLTPEHRAWIYRMYELHPRMIGKRENPRAGKRRFTRCALSLRKGSAKTEVAGWITIVEAHPEGPVRFDGWDSEGNPVGRPVTDPYIPMISYSEEQTEELAYGAVRRIIEESEVARDFDVGLQRILRLDGHGKIEAVPASPNARDGARTTFMHADETHRFTLDGKRQAWVVMLNNLAKRPGADPWALETTTAYEPGAGSVAESTHDYARAMMAGPNPSASNLFFYHRQASDACDMTTRAGRKKAVIEASGKYIAAWSDIDRIAMSAEEPDADLAYWERVWTNRPTQSSGIAFDSQRWLELGRDFEVPAGAAITLGFDGSRFDKAAALIATDIKTGFQWPLRIWEKSGPEYQVPIDELNGAVADAFERFNVCRFYVDPPNWESYVAHWAGTYDADKRRVFEWWTNRRKPMAYAIRSFHGAITGGELSHNGDPVFTAHIGNSRKIDTQLQDEDGRALWLIREERAGAPIDAASAAVLSWEARNDAIAAGEGVPEEVPVYEIFAL